MCTKLLYHYINANSFHFWNKSVDIAACRYLLLIVVTISLQVRKSLRRSNSSLLHLCLKVVTEFLFYLFTAIKVRLTNASRQLNCRRRLLPWKIHQRQSFLKVPLIAPVDYQKRKVGFSFELLLLRASVFDVMKGACFILETLVIESCFASAFAERASLAYYWPLASFSGA